jgi:outer membrane lipopolysaccharide assembly protein LptE/RlpB
MCFETMKAIPKRFKAGVAALLFFTPLVAGCGYRLAGSGIDLGAGQTLAVPVFANQTTDYKVEQRLTEAVRRELIQRTRYEVLPDSVGDVVLSGEVLNVTQTPIIFTSQGRGTAYTVAVEVYVKMTDSTDGHVLFESQNWVFREVFELSNDSETFIPEDVAAMERLAKRFASSLVASLFYTRP